MEYKYFLTDLPSSLSESFTQELKKLGYRIEQRALPGVTKLEVRDTHDGQRPQGILADLRVKNPNLANVTLLDIYVI